MRYTLLGAAILASIMILAGCGACKDRSCKDPCQENETLSDGKCVCVKGYASVGDGGQCILICDDKAQQTAQCVCAGETTQANDQTYCCAPTQASSVLADW